MNEKIPDWFYVKAAYDYSLEVIRLTGTTEVGLFVFTGNYLVEWLRGINDSIIYDNVRYICKLNDHTTILFNDEYGVNCKRIGGMPDKTQFYLFIAFVFKYSGSFISTHFNRLSEALENDPNYIQWQK